MAYNIQITNGVGSEQIKNGEYSASALVNGYDNTSLDPSTLTVVEGTNEYNFLISATGTLTVHVSEEGLDTSTPIVEATFKRTDSSGNEYGDAITSDSSGNAVFNNVPFSATEPPIIYFKQISSDGNHEFSTEVRNTTLTTQTGTIEVENPIPATRIVNLTDANYSGLPLNGEINLQ